MHEVTFLEVVKCETICKKRVYLELNTKILECCSFTELYEKLSDQMLLFFCAHKYRPEYGSLLFVNYG